MKSIAIAYKNILETGTVSVTSEDSEFPAYRLYDRRFKRLFKGTSAVDHTIAVDQGASQDYIDCLIIPAGHNLGGTLYWEYSFNGSSYYSFYSTIISAGNMLYFHAAAPVTARFWRLRLTGLSAPPEIGELIMSKLYEFDATPGYGLQTGKQKNVTRIESPSGVTSYLRQGDPRGLRAYTLSPISDAERAEMETWDATWQGTKPFFLIDHTGAMMFVELQDDMIFTEDGNDQFSCDLNFLEAL